MKRATHYRIHAAVVVAVLIVLAAVAAGAQTGSFRDRYDKQEYMAPMRDGVRMYVSVYVPKDAKGKHPILLERTPYGAGPYGPGTYRFPRGSRQFVENGYIFAYSDVRGQGRSEGRFVNDRPQLINPLKPHDIDESTDTYDTIDYLVKNVPGNNGRVGLWGISYPGFYAGVGAIHNHPALRAASPQAPVSDWFVGDDFHHHGALFLMDAIGFAKFGQTAENARATSSLPGINTGGDPYRFYLENGTLAGLTEKYFRGTDGLWPEVMEHGTYDEYWQARSLPRAMQDVRCPILTVGGWFDAEDCWGALHTYQGARRLNPRTSVSLVMGPWYHGMWAGPRGDRFGDLDFGQPTSTYYQEQIEFPFFDRCLRGNGRPNLPAATLFETGANRWRTFARWPPRERKERSFYLLPDRGVGDAPASGAEYDEYVSDPANPVPYQKGTIRSRTREYMIDDQRFASARSDVLTYQTAPLAAPITVAGPITADLRISTTGTDADFVVKVIDVFPADAPGKMAGYQQLLRADVLRAKFRNSYSNPAPLTPGTVEKVGFELPDVLHTFLPGHRMMVQVQSSWFPLVDRNPQTFTDIYHAPASAFQKATIRVYHTAANPSRLVVGVLPTSRETAPAADAGETKRLVEP